ncbi:Signal transduction histidine kinase [Andreprevotia lacus DSM 23236]|jgi:signal transduction histidine kinase|uniref:histidine kinase n=1 Tax=Andreprevotia lacus DSM 23236 TaxID=1121001 RepID=A0A1W1XWG3_9NEIS|nr:sensor histidine kinase [Andreprevotia lacus]SMC27881.1 Signal transduction histidine kinase [Andreprevotia lacus DSM 23236]
MHILLRFLLVLLLTLTALPAGAAAVHIAALDDYAGPAGGAATLDAVLAADARFHPLARHRPTPDSARWLRIRIANPQALPQSRVLALGVPDLEMLDVYQLDRTGLQQRLSLPYAAPYAARPLAARQLAIPLQLPAGDSTLYLHYRVHGDTPLQAQLTDEASFRTTLGHGDLLNGLVLGMLLVMLGLAATQYLLSQQQAYAYYAVMVALVMAFILQIEGYLFAWLWPAQGRWNQFAPIALQGLAYLGHAAFTVSLFDLRRQQPRLFAAYGVLAAGAVLSMLVRASGGPLWPLVLVSLCYIPLPLLAGWQGWRARQAVAGLFLAGALCVTLCVNLLFGLAVLGVVGGDPFLYPKLGYLLEALFFGAALIHQVQMLQRSHEKHLQARLREAEQLAQVEADKTRLLEQAQQQQLQLAAAGHDLSQPLAALRYGLAALRQHSAAEDISRHLDQSLSHTESLLRELISDARQGYALHAQQLMLEDLLIASLQRYHAQAAAKGLQLRYRPCDAQMLASRVLLERIIDNLLGNAVRYTERGGVLLAVRKRRGMLVLQVFDTGPGISAHLQQRLLAPFTQSGQLAAERQGHGLGLHIVQTLCQQAGYTLQLRSRPGRGSCFSVWLG